MAKEPPFQMNTMNVMSPYCFKAWLEKQRASLASGGPIDMFGAQFETEVQSSHTSPVKVTGLTGVISVKVDGSLFRPSVLR